MKISVVGASGRTGRQVVEQAVQRGLEVTAIARTPAPSPTFHPGVRWVAADVLRPESVNSALEGSDAVVSALGAGTSRQPTHVYSDGIRNLLSAMAIHRIDRIVVISAAPVGAPSEHPAFQRRLLLPVLERFFGATYRDMRAMEAILEASGVDWVALRPPYLQDRIGTGEYRLDRRRPPARGQTITIPDLATALLDALDRADLRGHASYVAN
ncbi:NAD(P)H-binding protein [Paenarthrobacter sp. PH39-S1]|uniref:NAD(P)-dependent oxidoreductase n=1 Tax=Paenarthrobacter sp. PH39-S1 TaxID=3046204 RepID=UPI0024BAFBDC|nr:NAD(P)H-binding protein [Paenarthrobacter sp. PH39-S1]MDJ0356307.1 NAD(P)H-binding protein [Paenarthrobacter sp. PH39-S1]